MEVLLGIMSIKAILQVWIKYAFVSTAANPLLCSTDRFHCRNGLCIDKSFMCDNQNNCQDNSDEESCGNSHGKYEIENMVFTLGCLFLINIVPLVGRGEGVWPLLELWSLLYYTSSIKKFLNRGVLYIFALFLI